MLIEPTTSKYLPDAIVKRAVPRSSKFKQKSIQRRVNQVNKRRRPGSSPSYRHLPAAAIISRAHITPHGNLFNPLYDHLQDPNSLRIQFSPPPTNSLDRNSLRPLLVPSFPAHLHLPPPPHHSRRSVQRSKHNRSLAPRDPSYREDRRNAQMGRGEST